MKLREAAIRLTLDDWADGSSRPGHGYVVCYPRMTYWYGSSIFVCMEPADAWGISLAERNTGNAIRPFWPDPSLFSVDLLSQLDEDVGRFALRSGFIDPARDEIIAHLKAFKRKVGGDETA